jgi:hypothetical protein
MIRHVFLLPKTFKLFGFPVFWLWTYLMNVVDFERTWWMLLTLNVPDECCWLWTYLMNVVDFERTWWMLFQNRAVCTKLDLYVVFDSLKHCHISNNSYFQTHECSKNNRESYGILSFKEHKLLVYREHRGSTKFSLNVMDYQIGEENLNIM